MFEPVLKDMNFWKTKLFDEKTGFEKNVKL